MVNFTLTFFVNTPSAINDSLDKSSKFAYVFSNILWKRGEGMSELSYYTTRGIALTSNNLGTISI